MRSGAGTGPESRSKQSQKAKPGGLETSLLRVMALLSCAIAPLEEKNLSCLLEIVKSYKRFF